MLAPSLWRADLNLQALRCPHQQQWQHPPRYRDNHTLPPKRVSPSSEQAYGGAALSILKLKMGKSSDASRVRGQGHVCP